MLQLKTDFYVFQQTNSGGSFETNDKLCHMLVIEANSESEAVKIAEDLGCYWNGVDDGVDCPCCGDRWYQYPIKIDLHEINVKWKGWEITHYSGFNGPAELKEKFKGKSWIVEPTVEKSKSKVLKKGKYLRTTGRLKIESVEDYAQLLADLYGWTYPDGRIFYKNGTVKEVFSEKVKPEPTKKKSKSK